MMGLVSRMIFPGNLDSIEAVIVCTEEDDASVVSSEDDSDPSREDMLAVAIEDVVISPWNGKP